MGYLFFASFTWLVVGVQPEFQPPADWIEIRKDTKWCGAKGLWLIAQVYGQKVSLEHVKFLCDPTATSSGEVNLALLKQAAENIGLHAAPVHCRVEWLTENNCPALTLHRLTKRDEQGVSQGVFNHFLVFLRTTRDGHLECIDPFYSNHTFKLTKPAFNETWTGDALLVAQRPENLPKTPRWLSPVLALDFGLVVLILFYALRRGIPDTWVRLRTVRSVLFPVLCVVATAGGCSKSAPNVQETVGANDSASVVRFDHTHHYEGTYWDGPDTLPIKHSFRFVNCAGKEITITDVKKNCACTDVTFPRESIPKNGAGEISVTLDLKDRKGTVTAAVALLIDSSTEPAAILNLSAFVVEPAKTIPDALDFGRIPGGKTIKKTMLLRMPLGPHEEPPRDLKYSKKNPALEYSWRPGEKYNFKSGALGGNEIPVCDYEVTASIRSTNPGQDVEDVLEIELPQPRKPILVKAHGFITHPRFDVEASIINLGPVGTRPVRRTVSIRCKSKGPAPIESVSVRPEGTPVKAWIEEKEKGESLLIVETAAGAAKLIKGDVVLNVRDREFPEYAVPFIGFSTK